jgi:hypothetical protein
VTIANTVSVMRPLSPLNLPALPSSWQFPALQPFPFSPLQTRTIFELNALP